MARSKTNWIVIHCSATRGSQNFTAADIRRWHLDKGWKDIGYHYVIRRDGMVEPGRAESAIGSHVQGHNADSIGVCLVGGIDDTTWKPADNFTPAQWRSLRTLVERLVKTYPSAKVLGHRDFPGVKKACPSFAAKVWAKKNGFPT
jgi:N-acetylmuramoyl-L-alanine amidase